MFYAFNWLQKPSTRLLAWVPVTNWLRSYEMWYYWEDAEVDNPAPLRKQRVSQAELIAIDRFVKNADQLTRFGGYTTGAFRKDITGLVYFSLNETRQEARLTGLIVRAGSGPGHPLQLVELHQALRALLEEEPNLERVYLPFVEISARDRAALLLQNLTPGDQPGWWQVSRDEKPADMLDWLEIKTTVPAAKESVAAELFTRYSYLQRLAIERIEQEDGAERTEDASPVTLRIHIRNDEQARDKLERLREVLYYLNDTQPFENLDVLPVSKEEYRKFWNNSGIRQIGRHLVVKPPRESYAPGPDEVVLEIDTAMPVFGTDHPTTVLILRLLENQLDPTQHRNVLDLGTGSGILAIAAAKLGAAEILALDTNPDSVELARRNVAANGLTDRITVEAGSLAVSTKIADWRGMYSFSQQDQQPPAILAQKLPFDAIFANLLTHHLIALVETFVAALRPGGLLLSSGIAQANYEQLLAVYEAAGLTLVGRSESPEWVSFAHTKRTEV
jgi:ribosomal protein L11 methyltransferase